MQPRNVVPSQGASKEPVLAWVESLDGAIVRGVVDLFSEDGAVIQFADGPRPAAGDEVSVRLRFTRDAPTQAARGRVLAVRAREDAAYCEVAWAPGADPFQHELATLD